ncbi:phage scaffolding protein [Listeria ivanovii]|uniref:phage scaffolding protein n=1 Tax=Listeria ivanovii TaxID=1638 RepID=UPI0019449598|nr:phage scaffolding protein [Listeria ivanovii]MBM5707371.1 scaffolding protein [Listeria ivanovii]
MKREFLEGLGLEKEAIDSIMSEHGKSTNELRSKVTELETEKGSLAEQLTQRDSDIDSLRKDSGTSAELKTQLEKWQEDYKNLETKSQADLAETRLNSAIDLAFTKEGAKNIKATRALLNFEKLELGDDGTVKGLDDQLAALKESDGYLFPEQEESNDRPRIVNEGNPQTLDNSQNDPFAAKLAKYQ